MAGQVPRVIELYDTLVQEDDRLAEDAAITPDDFKASQRGRMSAEIPRQRLVDILNESTGGAFRVPVVRSSLVAAMSQRMTLLPRTTSADRRAGLPIPSGGVAFPLSTRGVGMGQEPSPEADQYPSAAVPGKSRS